jgi:hypothetical protein
MGFSPTGLLLAVILLLPNILVLLLPPRNLPVGLKDAGIIFTVLERIGQAGMVITLILSKDNFQGRAFDIWEMLMIICIAAYYFLWLRYAVKGHDFTLLWKPFAFIPIPMAIFPAAAFGFAALWGKSRYLGAAVIAFALGHFANSWHSYKFSRK